MENKNIKTFKVRTSIPFTSIKINTIIKKIGDGYYVNVKLPDGCSFKESRIPFFNDELAQMYCYEIQVYPRQIDDNMTVLFESNAKHDLAKGQVVSFDEFTGKYEIKYVSKNRTYYKHFKFEQLIVPKKYYFLSSKGIVQDVYEYNDCEADNWRKLIGNYFESKEDCKAYKEQLLRNKDN